MKTLIEKLKALRLYFVSKRYLFVSWNMLKLLAYGYFVNYIIHLFYNVC